MHVKVKEIPVNRLKNVAEIDASDYKHIYIVKENGEVAAVALPEYGTLEISCQNHRIGNVAVRATIKV